MGKVEVRDSKPEPEREIVIKAGGGAELIKLVTTPEMAKQGAANLAGGGEVTTDDLRQAANEIDALAHEREPPE